MQAGVPNSASWWAERGCGAGQARQPLLVGKLQQWEQRQQREARYSCSFMHTQRCPLQLSYFCWLGRRSRRGLKPPTSQPRKLPADTCLQAPRRFLQVQFVSPESDEGWTEDNPLANGKLQGAVTCLLLVHVPRERSHTIQGEHTRMAKK